jgi:hypothetical protein
MGAEYRIETYQILKVMTLGEFNNLSTDNKDLLKMMLSVGVIDLQEGSWTRGQLFGMFPGNTDTGQALRDPANGFIYVPNEPTPIP